MRILDIIEKKAAKLPLTTEEIDYFVDAYTNERIPDYQASSLLMAIRLNGMDERETVDLTRAMLHSGDTIDLSDLPGVKLDKHSTGGVGDTTTLVIAPLVAACGGTVAKMSGRGLSFTGGTLDKLESFPGLSVEQSMDSFRRIVLSNGVAVIGQSGNLVPADKKLYALRDVTGTVGSVPLIAASIMSKKLAAGTDAIVLDVKYGSGAFMHTPAEADALARLMVLLGRRFGKRMTAVLTDMNQPLGMAVGNALEVREAIELLSGKVSAGDPLYEICMLLGTQMLLLTDLADSSAHARSMLEDAIRSGSGLSKLRAMIEAEGGDGKYVSLEHIDALCRVKKLVPVYARENGYIGTIRAEEIGYAAMLLGAGRAAKEDVIDYAVGLIMHKRLGDAIMAGEPLCTMYVNDETNLSAAMERFLAAISVFKEKPFIPPMVYGVIKDDML